MDKRKMQISIYDFKEYISITPITLKIIIYYFVLGPLHHFPVSIPITEASKTMGSLFPLCCTFTPAFFHKRPQQNSVII